MADKSPANAETIAVLPLLLIWMAAILPVYHPNMGGDGLALPQNILAWGVMALTTLIVTFTVCLGRIRLSLTPTARLLLLGIAVLALPLLYTRPEWREDALWRCAGLLGGWLFYSRLPAAARHRPAARAAAVRPVVCRRHSGVVGGFTAVRPRAGLGIP